MPDNRPAARMQTGSFRPFFIVGFERSGTTLLSRMLARHSQLAVALETHFLLKIAPSSGNIRGRRSDMLERLFACERTADLQLDRDDVTARFAAYEPTYPNLLRVVLETYALAQGKPMPGEKTPFHLWKAPQIYEWYPEAKVICIVRDGRDAVMSLLTMPWAPHHIVRLHSHRWVAAVKAACRFQNEYHSRFMLVRYEDLIDDPREQLQRIDDFLGVPYEPRQLIPDSPGLAIPPMWHTSLVRATQAIDAKRIGLWREAATVRQQRIMNSMMGPALRDLGYSDFGLPDAPPLVRAYHAAANLLCRLQLFRLFFNLFLRPKARRARARRMARRV